MPGNPLGHFRETLVPKGTSDLVRLSMKSTAFYKHEFVLSLIAELEQKIHLDHMGLAELTNTDRLLYDVLCDSSGWEQQR